MAARSRPAPPGVEIEDPTVTIRREVWAIEKLVAAFHAPVRVPRDTDGRIDDDVASAYNLAVLDICQAASRVACKIGF